MLYEVITVAAARQAVLGGAIVEHDLAEGADVFQPETFRYLVVQLNGRQLPLPRITSYNVCYTKLLRSEIDAADTLEAFRAAGERFEGLSFPSISAFGSHGAIVHYP